MSNEKDEAVKIADEKRTLAVHAASLAANRAELERSVKKLRASIMAEVTAETNGDGKPKYSNAEKREAELVIREKEDFALQGLLSNVRALDAEAAQSRIDYEYASDMLRIALAFAGG